MHIALSISIRLSCSILTAIVAAIYYKLSVSAGLNIFQASFFLSFALYQPDWYRLLAGKQLDFALSQLQADQVRLICGKSKSHANCTPIEGRDHHKSVELLFCRKRVEARILKLEDDLWKFILPASGVCLLGLLFSFSEKTLDRTIEEGLLQVFHVSEVAIPICVFAYAAGSVYGEIVSHRQINLAAAGL